jgi:hypothetical protein
MNKELQLCLILTLTPLLHSYETVSGHETAW